MTSESRAEPEPFADPLVTIRLYRDSDWEALCEIHDQARLDELRDSVDPAAFLPLAATAEGEGLFAGELWVACAAKRVVGFIAFAGDEITWLYVHPHDYRRGIGRRLLRHALARCGRPVVVEALSGNTAALQLYQSEGFEIVEVKTGRLVGNESFTATGMKLVLSRPRSGE